MQTDGRDFTKRTALPWSHRLSRCCAAGLTALVLFAGCGGQERGGSVSVTIDTVNGAVRVRNAGVPARWELHELVTLGTGADSDTSSAQEFSGIVGLIADAQHNIYVADGSEIRVFDEQGQLVRRFGREGSGPGEFRSLQSIGWLGDTLLTMDWRNVRIGLMTPTGEWVGQRELPAISGSRIRFHQTGPAELYSSAVRRDGSRSQFAYVRQTMSGDGDTIGVPPSPEPISPTTVACDIQNGITFYTPSFAPQTVKQPAPNTTLLDFSSAEYRLHFIKLPDTVRIIERDLPRQPVSDDEWSREEARFRAWRDSLTGNPVCRPAGPHRPEAKELLRGVFFDDQSRIWVERQNGAGFTFDVLDADGTLLAELDAPERSTRVPIYVRGDRLYLVTTDSLDVQFVKAFQILPGGR